MVVHANRRSLARIVSSSGLAATVLMLGGGCSTGGKNDATRVVTAADFAGAPSDAAAITPEPRPAAIEPPAQNAIPDVAVIVGAPAADPFAAAGATAPANGAPPPARVQTYFVDQMVGQINGRPIYASEFFEPMDERLKQDAQKFGEREWLSSTRKLITQALADRLRDDLILAEFQSTITPEQRTGVLTFITNVREGLISGNLGSESLANQRLRESEGLSLDEKVKDITERRFIIEQLRKSIGSRVQVSQRDVELYYEKNADEFSPPPIAEFRIILAPKNDSEKLERIEKALAAGEDFAAVAQRESAYKPDDGNLQKSVIKGRVYTEAQFFGPQPLNEAARALTPGAASSRIDVGTAAYWLKLERIDQPPSKSLYDAQLEIERKLYAEREEEERLRYFDGLLARGSFSDVKDMVERLLIFSAKRYLGAEREGAARRSLATPPAADTAPPASEPK